MLSFVSSRRLQKQQKQAANEERKTAVSSDLNQAESPSVASKLKSKRNAKVQSKEQAATTVRKTKSVKGDQGLSSLTESSKKVKFFHTEANEYLNALQSSQEPFDDSEVILKKLNSLPWDDVPPTTAMYMQT